jgi:hypothetical protein
MKIELRCSAALFPAVAVPATRRRSLKTGTCGAILNLNRRVVAGEDDPWRKSLPESDQSTSTGLPMTKHIKTLLQESGHWKE